MAWQDTTIQVDEEGTVDLAPDDKVHMTWHEKGASLTVICSRDEAERLMSRIAKAIAATTAAVVVLGIDTIADVAVALVS
jgi:hypothetical protein